MFNAEDISNCLKFKDNLSDMLKDIRDAAKCIIPLNDIDDKIIKNGISSLDAYIKKLDEVETLRDLNTCLDVNAYINNQASIDDKLSGPNMEEQYNKFMNSLRMRSDCNDKKEQ